MTIFSGLFPRPSLRTSSHNLPCRHPLKTSSNDFSSDILSGPPCATSFVSLSHDFLWGILSQLLFGPLLKTCLRGAPAMTSFEETFPRPPLAKAFRTSSHNCSENGLSRLSVTTSFRACHDLLSGPPLTTSLSDLLLTIVTQMATPRSPLRPLLTVNTFDMRRRQEIPTRMGPPGAPPL